MRSAADGPFGSAPPPTRPDCTLDTSTIDEAIDEIARELALTQGDLERVATACRLLRHDQAAWHSGAVAERLRALAPLVTRGSSEARPPVVELLHDVAEASADPWRLFADLLESHDRPICEATLGRVGRLVESGRLHIDDRMLLSLARLVESGPELLRDAPVLEQIRTVLRAPPDGALNDATLEAMYLATPDPPLRRLVARLLDLSPGLPPHTVAARILGRDLAEYLDPYLAYTRATHLDLLDLASGTVSGEALLASLRRAETQCGPALLRQIVSALGWKSLNSGLAVTVATGVSINGSFPLLMTAPEAALVERGAQARRVFERFVVEAHAATPWAGDGSPSAVGAIDRFRRYNVRHADLLVDLLDVAPLTVEKVRRMLQLMRGVVDDFAALFGAARADECAAVAATYLALEHEIEGQLTAASPGQPVPSGLTRLVQMFEDPLRPSDIHTLHGCKRYLHQRGLQLGAGLAESARATNCTVTLAVASATDVLHVLRAVDYADFEGAQGTAELPLVVRVAVEAFARHLVHGERSFPRLRIFCYGNEVHCFAAFRNHPAFIRIDCSPPLRGGMIDLDYCGVSKYDLGWHPNVSLNFIEQIFRAADFDVQVVNTRIHARYDKERAADFKDLDDKLHTLFNLVPYLMDVDWVIGDLKLSDDARRDVAAAWARFFLDWGIVPIGHVLTADRLGILTGIDRTPAGDLEMRWSGSGPYRDGFSVDQPEGFWRSLREAIDEQGLAHAIPFDGERPIVQRTVEAQLLAPLREALERGQVVHAGGRFIVAAHDLYAARHEASLLAGILVADDDTISRSLRLARLIERLEGAVPFDVTGTIQGYDVQRAVIPLPGAALGLFVLRDSTGTARLALFSRDGMLYQRRTRTEDAWTANWSIDAESLAAELRRANFGGEWSDPGVPAAAPEMLRDYFSSPNAWARSTPLAADRSLTGVKASPGRAVGLARLGMSGRQPGDLDGGILIAPALSPRDNPFVFRAAGIVSTGGGVLSHAGLMALEFRKPAIVVNGRWERSASGAETLVYTSIAYREVHRRVGPFDVTERHNAVQRDERLQDGDLVVIDADERMLSVIGQDHDALALFDGLHQIASASRSLAAAASDAELLAQRGRMLRARHHLEKLLGRIEDPVLARYAATELVAGEAGAEATLGQQEKSRLLRAVLANVSVGRTAAGALEALDQLLRRRASALAETARQSIPVSGDPLEVLTLRLAAITEAELLANVSALCVECGLGRKPTAAPVLEDLDRVALARVHAHRAQILAEVAARSSGPPCRLRHLLRQLQRVDQLLGTPADRREPTTALWTGLLVDDAAAVQALSSRRVLRPADGGAELSPLVGSKAANLAEAERFGEGQLIPRWFVMTDRAFREVLDLPVATTEEEMPEPLRGVALREYIARIVGSRDLSDAEKSTAIRRAWETIPLPRPLVLEVAAAYAALAAEGRGPDDEAAEPFVAVRSSALEEDLEATARAGEFDTFLFVRGASAVAECLRRAWSGLWTERAIHNRAVLGVTGDVGGGVLIQRMVPARASGVLHTINLAEGRLSEMVINAGLGLGEGIVSGAVAADQIIVSKAEIGSAAPLRFRYITNDKRERVVFDARFGSGTSRVATLYHQRLRPALEYVELCEIVAVAARLESAYRQPLDIEFALEGSQLWVLQVRPVPAALAAWRDTRETHPFVRRNT